MAKSKLKQKQRIPKSNGTRNRSFGGCATCRSRHVKCDEGHPSCSTCKHFHLDCGGYEKSIFFGSENGFQEGTLRFRRPLLTEVERESMTKWLTSSVQPNSASFILSQIDNECESINLSHKINIIRGPFGVFSPSRQSFGNSEELPPLEHFDQALDTYLSPLDAALSPWNGNIAQSMFGQTDELLITRYPNFSSPIMESDPTQEPFDEILAFDFQECPATSLDLQGYALQTSISTLQSSGAYLFTPGLFLSSVNNNLPQNVLFLLKHYATTVVNSLTPFRHTKTPWHVLFIPHAKSCLAALALGERLDHASLGAFCSILAISAFSYGGISQSQTWLEQGQLYKKEAQEQIKLTLMTAYKIPKVAKYKSILMALISMIQLSMACGDRDQTECYLLEAEKFIRLRGLDRKKSRKVRLLHHCYSFERFFHESLFNNVMDSDQRHQVVRTIESSGLVIYGQDKPLFHLFAWSDLDQQMMEVKAQEDGENDLHIERPGIWPATLYPEIYGIPELWLFLLSQVIRLGSEKDINELRPGPESLSVKDFMSRAKAIEKCISQLQRPENSTKYSSGGREHVNFCVMDSMLEAFQSALLIYFYRRIYDVSASILQQHVVSVRDCLVRCEQTDPKVMYGSAGYTWPAFIAACEAEDPLVQASFAKWFKNCAQQSGLVSFTKTLESIEKVWQEKDMGQKDITWVDVMRNNRLAVQKV